NARLRFSGYLVFKERSCCLESASLQLCAEESIFLEPARRRKAASLSNPPCSFVPRNLASLNLLADAGTDAKQLKEFLIPSKLNETEARLVNGWSL
ncbi:hypothetical protein, partial [Geobacillus stearothermophilus]|uniref:hypothetical protein n=1 Tax=Geobacillus stearothermophilus TaxID=1422 RepID=UPI00240298F9